MRLLQYFRKEHRSAPPPMVLAHTDPILVPRMGSYDALLMQTIEHLTALMNQSTQQGLREGRSALCGVACYSVSTVFRDLGANMSYCMV